MQWSVLYDALDQYCHQMMTGPARNGVLEMALKTKTLAKNTTAPAPVVPTLSLTVGEGEAISTYAEKTVLTEDRHIADFLRLHAAGDDEAVAQKLAAVTTEQIMAVVKATTINPNSDDNANLQYVNAIKSARFMAPDLSEIPPSGILRMKGSGQIKALEYGAMVSKTTKAAMDSTIKAIIEGDAGPVMIKYRLSEDFKDVKDDNGMPFLDTIPPMSSQYRPKAMKGNKAPLGYKLPNDTDKAKDNVAVWHGPYQKYAVDMIIDGKLVKDAPRDWLSEFVAGGLGSGYAEVADHASNAAEGKEGPGEPDDIKKLRQQLPVTKPLLEEMAKTALWKFGRIKRIVGDAFKLLAGERALREQFAITVNLTGDNPEYKKTKDEAYRMKLPFQLTTETEGPDGKVRVSAPMGPYAANIVKNAEAKIYWLKHVLGKDDPSIADFLAPKPRGTKGEGETAGTQSETAKYPEIHSTGDLSLALSVVGTYANLDDAYANVNRKLSDPQDAGALASLLVGVAGFCNQFANNDAVQRLAKAHDDAALLAQASKAPPVKVVQPAIKKDGTAAAA